MKPLLLFLAIHFSLASFSQQFGAIPFSMKWKQIDTDTARIIFPSGAELQANRIATIIHKAAADTFALLGHTLRKVNIVLHNQTTTANGYVALGPFRSEFYLIPGSNVFDFGSLPWHENLALHEYRHVQQYNNFRHGISKVMSVLFGENGQALGNAMTVPDWFFEGDAVHTETAMSAQGRGRQPFFLSGYNSLWLENRNYSWLKLRNGSLKDYVPNHYQLGYLLSNYGYLHYGKNFWGNVTRDASAFKGLFYPFQKAIKKYSSRDYKDFREQALTFYRNKLGESTDSIANPDKTVTSYYFPVQVSPDSLLYLKKAYNRNPAFYIRDNNGEHKLSLQHISSEEWFSYRNGMIAYTSYSVHPRWNYVDYSDIILFDVKTKKQKRLTEKARYFTPDISPSGKKIIAISYDLQVMTNLDLIDAETGAVLKSFPLADQGIYVHSRFFDEERIVVGIRSNNSMMSLQMLDTRNDEWRSLVPPSYHSIGNLFVDGNKIYFNASYLGNDDVYVLDMKTMIISQLTEGLTGNYFPSVWGDTLIYSHFTSNGLAIRKKLMSHAERKVISAMTLSESSSLYPVALEKNILAAPTERFGVKRYSRGTGLFRFHSWAPDYSDPEFTFSLYSDNILNTFSNELFYRYNQNESSHGVGWNTTYGGFFPMLNAGVEYTYDRHIMTTIGDITLNQFEARFGYNIPLNLTKGKTYKRLSFGSNIVYNHAMPTGFFKDSLEAGSLKYFHHFISWSHYLPMAVQHINPKLGYTLSTQYRHITDMTGFQSLTNAQLFLPSFGNHSIVLQGSFQETDTSNTVFSNRFPNSRGYEDYYLSRMWKLGANYHFPIAYPDFGLASIVYLQRLRANLFFDFTRVYSRDKSISRDFRSTGAEIYFDTKWWNQLPVSFGFRASYLLDDGLAPADRKGNVWWEFILPVNLIQN